MTVPGMYAHYVLLEEENKRLREENERLSYALQKNADARRSLQARLSAAEEEQVRAQASERDANISVLRLQARFTTAEAKSDYFIRRERDKLREELAKWRLTFPQGPGVSADMVAALQARLSVAEDEVEKHANNDCIRELEQMVEEADERGNALSAHLSAANQVWQDQEIELRRVIEENERLKEQLDPKSLWSKDLIAELKSLQARLSAAEENLTASEAQYATLYDQKKRAEAVVEAAKAQILDDSLDNRRALRDAVRRYEEGKK